MSITKFNYPIEFLEEQPMSSAPKNGEWLLLKLQGGLWPMEDAETWWTMGSNNFDNDGRDIWNVVGWCWDHDHMVPLGISSKADPNPELNPQYLSSTEEEAGKILSWRRTRKDREEDGSVSAKGTEIVTIN